METPVLSKKQQKKALSAKKGGRETVKNVLTIPFTHYWPLASEEDGKKITESLDKNLPKLQHERHKVPWKEIKSIPKEERKEFRQKFIKEEPQVLDATLKPHLIFGINEVTKCLENETASSILIASDVNPQFMVKHVVNLAVLQDVPTVVVPNLRNTLKQQTGLTSVCFCLKNDFDPKSPLRIIDDSIKEVARNHPVPKHHINYKRRLLKIEEKQSGSKKLLNFESDEEMDVDRQISGEEDRSFLSFNTSMNTTIGKREDVSEEGSDSDENEPEGGWYVYKKEEDWKGERQNFYGLGETTDHGETLETNNKNTRYFEKGKKVDKNKRNVSNDNRKRRIDKEYNSLKVKRIKGNKNRFKTTIDRLRNRSKCDE